MISQALVDYYRCPGIYADLYSVGELSDDEGFFRLSQDVICYGSTASGYRKKNVGSELYDVSRDIQIGKLTLSLPFHLTQVVDNLRYERYFHNSCPDKSKDVIKTFVRNAYYWMRPFLLVSFRKYLQRAYLRGWEKIPFPSWPVDRSVEQIFERILILLLYAYNVDRLPFIWFWPDGHQGCAVMTHDVETASGRDFCSRLMDIDDSFGVKSSFQLIPEKRYEVTNDFLSSIQDRRFEINLHGLNHDGHLFSDREGFLRQVQRINQYAKEWSALGFRAPIMYRNLEWYGAFNFSYDMSVPNTAHLDPQRGGCCTVMPYFIDQVLELPLTTIQDYALFNIINEKSISLWKRQIELIIEKHGLISFLVHPDYIIDKQCCSIYQSLLEHLTQLCRSQNIWIALPKEVNSWWRQRSQMKLVDQDGKWRIEGEGKERARVAYATLVGEKIAYEIEENACRAASPGTCVLRA
jgi:hypothetical protein